MAAATPSVRWWYRRRWPPLTGRSVGGWRPPGRSGEQESLVVHRIHTRTGKTKRDEWYPASFLEQARGFQAAERPIPPARGRVYPIPGLLVVKPREDGDLEVTVDLTVTADGRSQRKIVRFRMDPSEGGSDEFIFLPAEIVNNIGKSPDEWEDPAGIERCTRPESALAFRQIHMVKTSFLSPSFAGSLLLVTASIHGAESAARSALGRRQPSAGACLRGPGAARGRGWRDHHPQGRARRSR